ncbi:hypothetical protein SUGI_0223450 [Cryptomeria japonica]|nr:hypothetical protein SUGI_0223450 [Cryptomeria japonica]
MVPYKELEDKSSLSRDEQFIRAMGMLPIRLLLRKTISLSLHNLPISIEMLPLSLLERRYRYRNLVNVVNISDGIGPSSAFQDSDRTRNFVQLLNDLGIVLSKRLLPTKRLLPRSSLLSAVQFARPQFIERDVEILQVMKGTQLCWNVST